MNYYDENQNDEYKDDFYVPKKDKVEKKKERSESKKQKKNLDLKKYKKTFIILGIILLIIVIIGTIFFVFKKNNNSSKELENIIINNNTYSPTFSKDVYDYYLLTEDKELNIECQINKKVKTKGCNETINLSNYSNYIHEIIIDGNKDKIYKIYIKVKESDSEENISINSIDGLKNSWTNQNQIISINASCKNRIAGYSIDNGLTWQESSTFEVTENNNLKIIVEDEYGNQSAVRQVRVTNIDKDIPIGMIIKDKSSSNEITLKVIAKDETSGIDSYKWSDGSTKNTLTITKKGTYSVTIKDKAGNISDAITIDIKESDFNNKEQFAAVFYNNGSTSISTNFLSCTKKDDKCNITLPTITRDDAQVIGWSTNKDAKTAEYESGEKIELTKNLTLYAITKKEVTATFEKNNAQEISSNKESCTIYNNEEYCFITAPNIIYNNGKIIGWNIFDDAKTVLESPKGTIKLSNNTTYYALAYKEVIISFNKNGSDSISSTKEICRLESGAISCFITTPMITRDDSTIIGWSTNKDATTTNILVDSELEVNKDLTLYAITKKDINIVFDKNGADNITSNKQVCSIYNSEKNCQITTPKITRSNANILGWNTDKDAKTSELDENKAILVTESATYYAITSKKVTATFNLNGADDISELSKSCTYYNAENGCSITTSDITRASWTVLGWNTNKNATQAQVKENAKISIKNDTTYYAITTKKLTATFYKNTADSLGNCTTKTDNACIETCNIYNNNTSCQVNIPYIYSKGNEVQFFSTTLDPSTTVGYSPAKKLNLLDDIELNAIVDNRYRKKTFTIIKTKNYGYTAFETESGCPSTVYNNYYNFIDRVYQKAPYIFTSAKVTFTSSASFQETWGNYSGMTYGIAIGYRNIDIKCPNSYSDYYLQTIVHELTHGWDSYYRAQKGNGLSDMSDFISLYNKYKNASKQPLRSYAYTNVAEFVADAYAWYYFLYIDTYYQPSVITSNYYYPSDLKTTVEKYIKIAKNGYT